MQCAYLNYLIKKNNVSSACLEEATGLSPATLSRVKTGQRELSPDEFRRIVAACGGDDASYKAFMSALEGSPVVKVDESVTISTVRKFYQEQLDDKERRFIHEMERMQKQHDLRVQELQNDLKYAREEREDAKNQLSAMQGKYEKMRNSMGRWRLAFCALFAAYATQWLLDWLVFKDFGFIITALRNHVDISLHSLRG